jgi:tRNA-Thr(GGU) m(6)t(6)A37 methyltransferase TsaA
VVRAGPHLVCWEHGVATVTGPPGLGPVLQVVGRVRSDLVGTQGAPRQPDEGAPTAWVEVDGAYRAAAEDLRPGDRVVLLTWLHLADRGVLRVHPRDDPDRPETGVFSTRSQDRPNPVGLHEVTVLEVDDGRFRVDALEAVDGTPVIDVKPVLPPSGSAR